MVLLVSCILAAQIKSHSLVLGGDVMLNGISIHQKPLAKLAPLFKPASTAIVNLEIPLTTATTVTPNKSADAIRRRDQFVLKADPNHAPALASIGVDLVSLGNNHAMDYREEGLAQMQEVLTKHAILHCGAGVDRSTARQIAVFTAADGKRIGLFSALAFMSAGGLGSCTPATEKRAGVMTLPFGGVIDKKAVAALTAIMTGAKQQCDILIVGLHWGLEKKTLPTPYQVALGRACIDAGADVVWGNHPHVLQGAELYKGKPILYSMGNLISPRGGPTGVVKLVYGATGFEWGQFFPLSISGGRVGPVNGKPGQRAVKEFERLCSLIQKRYPHREAKAMFPDTKLMP